ncbi:MAG: L-threonylcarbamoyladenylate synthase [Bacteroidales bacterium]
MISKDINKASEIIRGGGLVAFPTETVYGLGANALDSNAVAKIFEAKERPTFDPLIVHIAKIEDISRLSIQKSTYINVLAENFWPGPLTIVLEKSGLVPDLVTSGLNTVGIRMPDNPIALELINKSGCPIAAPSANKFGRISPTKAEHVHKQLPFLECILDGGGTKIGIESTVIRLHDDGFQILRNGFITESDLIKHVPKSNKTDVNEVELASPGLLKSHYSPEKPVYIKGNIPVEIDYSKAAYLSFYGEETNKYKLVEYLSKNQNLTEAAANLFTALHTLEDSDCEYIIADQVPMIGIGKAIMDRLSKASYRFLNSSLKSV